MNAAELEMKKRKDDAKERHFEQMTYAGYMRLVHDGFFDYRRRQLENQSTNASSYEAYMKEMHDAFFLKRMGGWSNSFLHLLDFILIFKLIWYFKKYIYGLQNIPRIGLLSNPLDYCRLLVDFKVILCLQAWDYICNP